MAVRHSTRITPQTPYGGDLSALYALRRLEAIGAAPTLSQAARDALRGVHGGVETGAVFVTAEATIELESNRQPTAAFVDVRYGDVFEAGTVPAHTPTSVPDSGDMWSLFDGRRNPPESVLVADVGLADDGLVTAGGSYTQASQAPHAVTVDGGLVASVQNAGATIAGPAWTGASTVADAASPHSSGRAFSVAATANTFARAPLGPCAYWRRTARELTATAYVRVTGGTVTLRPQVYLEHDTPTVGSEVLLGPAIVVAATGTTYTRVAGVVPMLASSNRSRRMRVEWQVVSATSVPAGGLRLAAPELYAGADRGPLQGLAVAIPPHRGLGYDLSYRDDYVDHGGNLFTTTPVLRRVTRVDVHGSDQLGHVTAASVLTSALEVGLVVGSVDVPASVTWRASAAGPGRLSATFAEPVDCYHVVVIVEETSSGHGAPVYVAEIDAQHTVDVSGRIVDLEIETTRELDPTTGSVFGVSQASTITLTLDNADRALSPLHVESIDTGHRIETAMRVHYAEPAAGGGTVEVIEAVPTGVFYSDAWDAPGDSPVAVIEGVDRLGRFASTDVAEVLELGVSAPDLVRDLAFRYLDLGRDEIVLDVPSTYVIPAAFPTGNLGQYLADLAAAVPAVIGMDRLDRLVLRQVSAESLVPAAELGPADAVVRAATPPGIESIRTVVTARGEPLTPRQGVEVYRMGDDAAITVAAGQGVVVLLPFTSSPATDVAVSSIDYAGTLGVVATIQDPPYAGFVRFAVVNFDPPGTPGVGVVRGLTLTGTYLEPTPIEVQVESRRGIKRYGRRELILDGRLVQTEAQLRALAQAGLDTFVGLDAAGRRRPADAEVVTLGRPDLEVGDVVSLAEPQVGVSGDHRLLRHVLTYGAEGLSSELVGRRVGAEVYLLADVHLSDDVAVAAL